MGGEKEREVIVKRKFSEKYKHVERFVTENNRLLSL